MSICHNCHAGCCRAYRLTITIYDLIDLANALGWKKALKAILFEKIPFNKKYKENDSIPFPFLFDGNQMRELTIKKVKSEIFPETQKCYFLKEKSSNENNLKANCAIYAFRPGMCRAYPIHLDAETDYPIAIRRKDPANSQTQKAYEICPKKFLSLEDFGIDNEETIKKKIAELRAARERVQAHNRIAELWNAREKKPLNEEIMQFIITETSKTKNKENSGLIPSFASLLQSMK